MFETPLSGPNRKFDRVLDFAADMYRVPSRYQDFTAYVLDPSLVQGDERWDEWGVRHWHDDREAWLHRNTEARSMPLHSILERSFGELISPIVRKHLERHGLFLAEFARRDFVQLASPILDGLLQKGDQLTDAFAASGIDFRRDHTIRTNTETVFYTAFEHYVFENFHNDRFVRPLTRWFERHRDPRTCKLCGATFRVIDLPNWAYRDSGGRTDFCHRCNIVERPKKADLLDRIRSFVDACGFIPNTSAGPFDRGWVERMAETRWETAVLAWARMGTIGWVKRKFGSWFLGMSAAGVLPEGVLVTGRGIRCVAPDGHECYSLEEQRIDAWLSENSIKHEREPAYPRHPKWNSSGRRRADWKVGEVYVEYFGLTGERNYDEKTVEKILLAKDTGIDLVAIYPGDLSQLDSVLGRYRARQFKTT